ncbi:MAG TPA: trypsin-like peptidase domain-containing protein [Candidatus Kapabacteria bacterium]|nr:trypsin-like peptidase domain-containing protein [Candidatus Kapabacteria bacterium]
MKLQKITARPFLLVAFGVLFGLGVVAGFGGMSKLNLAFGQNGNNISLGGPTPNIPDAAALQNMNQAFRALAKAIQPTVVSIHIKTEAPKITKKGNGNGSGNGNDQNNPFRFFFHNFPGNGDNGDNNDDGNFDMPFGGPHGVQEGLGSGVIITSDGYILTNNHVVADAAKKGGVMVKLSDKRTFDGKVIGTDPTTDLAIVKIEATGLPAAALGNSDDVQIGDWVIAVGNPLGLESTVTKGIVSSLGRQLDLPQEGTMSKNGNYSIANFIQTDAAINPGNSGGGLFNVSGQVIGINSAIATPTGSFAGYGFAIPVNLAKTVAMDLIKHGKVNRGYIGVTIRGVDATDAEALGMNSPHGVRIDNVVKNGAGEAAGLRDNDVILAIDGQDVNESNQLQGMIALHHVGDNVKLHIWRDGKETDVNVKLKARDNELATNENTDESSSNETASDARKETATLDNIGVSVRNLNQKDEDKYDTKNGVYITSVAPASEAYDRGLGMIGNVITKVGGKNINNVAEFEKAINLHKGSAVGLTIKDDKGDSRFVSIRIPND